MSKNVEWVIGNGYEKGDILPEITMATLEFVERVGEFHVYRIQGNGVNAGKFIATFNNQPEIRKVIRDNPHSVFGIGFFKAYSSYVGYTKELRDHGPQFLTTIARISVIMPGDDQHKRQLSIDPSGIILVK